MRYLVVTEINLLQLTLKSLCGHIMLKWFRDIRDRDDLVSDVKTSPWFQSILRSLVPLYIFNVIRYLHTYLGHGPRMGYTSGGPGTLVGLLMI